MTNPINPINTLTVPPVSITTARTGASVKVNELGMRTMQERAYTVEVCPPQSDSARTQPDRTRKLPLGDQPIDRRSL